MRNFVKCFLEIEKDGVCSNGNLMASLRIQSLHGGRGGSNKHY